MSDELSAWSIRSVLLSVSDLDRSAKFYEDVMNVHEVLRDDEIVVLGGDVTGSFTFYLRHAHRNATKPGQDALGLRSLTCNVSSFSELDRVEARLRSREAFRDRQTIDGPGRLELVRGHDPDRLALLFVASETGTVMSRHAYRQALAQLYAVDL